MARNLIQLTNLLKNQTLQISFLKMFSISFQETHFTTIRTETAIRNFSFSFPTIFPSVWNKGTSKILSAIRSNLNLIVLNNCQCSLRLSNTRAESRDPINSSRKGNRITSPPSVALNSSRVTNCECLVCIRKFALVICSLREELSGLRCRMRYVYQC